MDLRKTTPSRTAGVTHQKDYHAYRDQLAIDFNHRCGYCDDRDEPRTASFEIDHFVPRKVDANRETDYTNLVYSCKSCNNAKRAKWPTGDKTKPNNGNEGWIDPCTEDYDAQFERLSDGKIHPVTQLGTWMYDNLKLWKKQHELLWICEKIEKNIDQLEDFDNQGLLPDEQKDNLIRLYQSYRKVLKAFNRV